MKIGKNTCYRFFLEAIKVAAEKIEKGEGTGYKIWGINYLDIGIVYTIVDSKENFGTVLYSEVTGVDGKIVVKVFSAKLREQLLAEKMNINVNEDGLVFVGYGSVIGRIHRKRHSFLLGIDIQ